ncbi:MAG: ankyrin repeat domain-containing protein [Acidobacteriota bacterium]|nr:ankyrin repeat domain-containing protein [Acidobacteriota bacterium]
MSNKSFLDSIEVQSPCLQSWNEMRGGDQIRFCDHCAKDVHNLSKFTRKQARRLIARSSGGICVQYVRRPDGRIETLKKQLHQITRQTGIAAGVLGTSLGVSTLAYAQTPTDTNQTEAVQTVEVLKSNQPNSTISGTITDPNGAVIPSALVTISSEQTGFYQTVNSNQDGFYEFKDIPDGTYKMKVEAGGFEAKEITQVSVGSGGNETQNAQLTLQSIQAEVVVGEKSDIESYATVGIVAMTSSNVTRNRLVIAVEDNDIEDVKARILMGERVNAKDKGYDGNSPLHVAVENGNTEIAEVLLNAGAKINSKNFEKRTPLMMLDEDASVELVNLLLRHNAKINLADKEGNTALILAASYANKDVVQTLIGAGANVNAVNKQGETALMSAAENGEVETVQLLLGSGANPNARNHDGKTALALVKNDDAKQYLVAFGAMR